MSNFKFFTKNLRYKVKGIGVINSCNVYNMSITESCSNNHYLIIDGEEYRSQVRNLSYRDLLLLKITTNFIITTFNVFGYKNFVEKPSDEDFNVNVIPKTIRDNPRVFFMVELIRDLPYETV